MSAPNNVKLERFSRSLRLASALSALPPGKLLGASIEASAASVERVMLERSASLAPKCVAHFSLRL